MRIGTTAAALAALGIVAACAPPPAPPAPAPPAPPPPQPAPRPAQPPPPPAEDWRDRPLSEGDWAYGERLEPRAAFSAQGPIFVIECTADRRIRLFRMGAASPSSPLTIRTTFGERLLAASSAHAATGATLPASDPLLDELAFSRGRFLIRVDGLPDLLLPSWPEPARVIEECRG